MKRIVKGLLLAVMLLISVAARAEDRVSSYYDKGNMFTAESTYSTSMKLIDGRVLIQGQVKYVNETDLRLGVNQMTMVVCTKQEAEALCQLGASERLVAITYGSEMSSEWAQRVHDEDIEGYYYDPGQSFYATFSTIIDKADAVDVIVLFQEYSVVL